VVRTNLTLSHTFDSPFSSETEYLLKQLEVSLDKDLLQLVQGACKADNLSRALDATKMMRNQATVEAAGKVAGFYHLPGLQERIAGVRVDKRKTVTSSIGKHGGGGGGVSNGAGSKGFTDFKLRNGGARRGFGGVQRDATPVNRGETVVPETPGAESALDLGDDDDGDEASSGLIQGSPEGKRRRIEETPDTFEETSFAIPKPRGRPDPFPLSNGMSFFTLSDGRLY
jgi:chromosome transmission fidelity protein 4